MSSNGYGINDRQPQNGITGRQPQNGYYDNNITSLAPPNMAKLMENFDFLNRHLENMKQRRILLASLEVFPDVTVSNMIQRSMLLKNSNNNVKNILNSDNNLDKYENEIKRIYGCDDIISQFAAQYVYEYHLLSTQIT